MKIKELQKTVNIAWSPQQQCPIYLAAGTAAQQLDWNGTSVLEIYSTNLKDRGYDLELKASLSTQYRFQKLLWAPTEINSTHANGVLVGGCEGGHLMIYGVTKILAGEEALIAKEDIHTGPIRGLDFNPFQTNLLASVASESEIFVWDLNNTATHMTPGAKTQPYEDVQNVAWNRQVQHILATVFSSRCVIWDLRKNEQIIKLTDTQSRVRWRSVQWHPDIATQIWLASEEDQAPFIQMWDLRYATAPAKTIRIHERGVLGMSWCPKDCNMMASCGKDNRLYCWDPNTTKPECEILSEVAKTSQWYSDVQWCPRNPALIASSSLDGFVSIYSLFGGKQQQVQTSNKIADSFPGMDQFAQTFEPLQTTHALCFDPLKPPKWMKKTSGAKFGFGGKLLFFNSLSKIVQVKQTISEPDLLARALTLEKSLSNSTFVKFCRSKADEMTSQEGRYLWYFLKANFEVNPKEEMLNLLGFNTEDINEKFLKCIKEEDTDSTDSIVNRIATLTHKIGDHNRLFDNSAECNKTLADESKQKCALFKIPNGNDADSVISEAIITGNLEAAVQICLDNDRPAEALIIASTAGIECLTKTRHRYLRTKGSNLTNIITALVTRDWMGLVSRCTVDSWKEALVAALKHNNQKATDICEKLGDRLLAQNSKTEYTTNAMLCFICAENVEKLVNAWYKFKQLEKNKNDYELCTMELQELAEIVIILSKSLEQQGIAIEPEGKFADFISQYGSLLSAQGALSTAFTLVSTLGPSAHTDLEDLKDRLNNSLNGDSDCVKSDKFIAVAREHQRLKQQEFFCNKENTSEKKKLPTGLQWNSPLSAQQLSPLLPPPVATFSSQSISSQGNESNVYPPRPSSGCSQASTTLQSRAKYLLDSSVYSGSQHGRIQGYNSGYNASSQPPETTNSITFVSKPPTYQSSSMKQPFSTDRNVTLPSAQSNFNYMQLNPQSQVNNYLTGVPPVECGAQNLSGQSGNMQRNPTPPPGWNDPPLLKSTRQQLQKVETSATAITHPLFGVEPNCNQNVNLDPIATYQNKSLPPTCIVDQQPETVYRSNQGTNDPFERQINFQIASVMPQTYQQHLAEKRNSIQQINPEVAEEKKPLSEEFIYMHTVFEELKSQCLMAATDPRTKRKFVDVGKRLENLYDCLREGRLTSYTITSLNQIVQYIQIGDYGNALATHTSIAFGTDFAQTASFMPGIKVLVQYAADLNVYLR